ncbi:MAG: response regulator transcription factor [bacterium]
MNRVLLIDDDVSLRDLLQTYLESAGYDVLAVEDIKAFWVGMETWSPDIIILDLMLAADNGLTLLQKLRQHDIKIPVLILSAKGSADDRITGLELGADDYLPKPFEPRELLIRLRNLLRRPYYQKSDPPTLSIEHTPYKKLYCCFDNFQFDPENNVLMYHQQHVTISSREASLLRLFCEHQGTILSRDFLMRSLKGYDYSPFDRSMDVAVARLRKKLEKLAPKCQLIRTVWGKGYQLVNPREKTTAFTEST